LSMRLIKGSLVGLVLACILAIAPTAAFAHDGGYGGQYGYGGGYRGDQEKPGAWIASASVSMEGCQRDSVSGEHSRPRSASPPSRPPVFPGLPGRRF
jgi:hypothetical protein